MTLVQRFLKAVFPKSWGEAMEAESRTWMVVCGTCGYQRSVWDLGGVRWKAAGTPRKLARCPQCNTVGWHTVQRQEQ